MDFMKGRKEASSAAHFQCSGRLQAMHTDWTSNDLPCQKLHHHHHNHHHNIHHHHHHNNNSYDYGHKTTCQSESHQPPANPKLGAFVRARAQG